MCNAYLNEFVDALIDKRDMLVTKSDGTVTFMSSAKDTVVELFRFIPEHTLRAIQISSHVDAMCAEIGCLGLEALIKELKDKGYLSFMPYVTEQRFIPVLVLGFGKYIAYTGSGLTMYYDTSLTKVRYSATIERANIQYLYEQCKDCGDLFASLMMVYLMSVVFVDASPKTCADAAWEVMEQFVNEILKVEFPSYTPRVSFKDLPEKFRYTEEDFGHVRIKESVYGRYRIIGSNPLKDLARVYIENDCITVEIMIGLQPVTHKYTFHNSDHISCFISFGLLIFYALFENWIFIDRRGVSTMRKFEELDALNISSTYINIVDTITDFG